MVKSIKGKEIDMEAMQEANATTIALGNANMNARGDLIGRGGKILKTKEKLANEYHIMNSANTVRNAPIHQPIEINEPLTTDIVGPIATSVKIAPSQVAEESLDQTIDVPDQTKPSKLKK